MSQAEIYAYLKSHPKQRFRSKELAAIFKCRIAALTNSMKRLRESVACCDPKLRYKSVKTLHRPHYEYWYDQSSKKCVKTQ